VHAPSTSGRLTCIAVPKNPLLHAYSVRRVAHRKNALDAAIDARQNATNLVGGTATSVSDQFLP
jgi:hypothetical protein